MFLSVAPVLAGGRRSVWVWVSLDAGGQHGVRFGCAMHGAEVRRPVCVPRGRKHVRSAVFGLAA